MPGQKVPVSVRAVAVATIAAVNVRELNPVELELIRRRRLLHNSDGIAVGSYDRILPGETPEGAPLRLRVQSS